MILTLAAYATAAIAALVYGRRLYDSWGAATVLALMSPLPLACLTPLTGLVVFFFVGRTAALLGLSINPESDALYGLSALAASIICALTLRHFAKTEPVTQTPDASAHAARKED